MNSSKKIGVAVLGATGTVGQRMIALLENHPLFEVQELMASEKSQGKIYKDACQWRDPNPYPEKIKNYVIKSAEELTSTYALSALPADIAKEVEPLLASKGIHVVSNASAFRMQTDVPLVIPEVNPEHLELIKKQKTKGKIVTNPNCVAIPLTMGLSPLSSLSEIESVNVVTLQAISGAGYPGVSALDIMGNTIPYIVSEEEKIESESQKILGSANAPANFSVFAHANRVPVEHGHTLIAHINFKNEVSAQKVIELFKELSLSKAESYLYHEDKFSPCPKKSLSMNDIRLHVGRIKQGPKKNQVGVLFLAHNLARGAASAALLNLELLHSYLGASDE